MFDLYDIPDARGLDDSTIGDGSIFMNDPRTRAALHAPTSKDWVMTFLNVFGDPDGACTILRSHYEDWHEHLLYVAIDPSEFQYFCGVVWSTVLIMNPLVIVWEGAEWVFLFVSLTLIHYILQADDVPFWAGNERFETGYRHCVLWGE